MHFKINLTLISILIIVLYFNIPFYNNWMNTNLFNPAFDITSMGKQMSIEQRKVNRFGYSYIVYKEMSKIFKSTNIKNPVLLLPPDAFMKENKVKDFSIVEPAIFYYFTGYKGVWYNSPDVNEANCMVIPDGHGKVMIKKIESKEELTAIIAQFKKYKID
jgi:hypothetical protein